MSPAVIGLTLLAALLHATWNATLRSAADRFWSITVMSFATTVAAIPCALLLPPPLPPSWAYVGLSSVLQVGYAIFLANAYRFAELGQVYPIVRGSAPILVSVGAFLLAGQRISATALLGVALISLGIASLALGRDRAAPRSVALALVTAVFVASCIVCDGLGVRLAGDPRSYATWIFLVYGALMPGAFLALRRRLTFNLWAPETIKALTAGIISFASYGSIIAAFALGNIAPIAALRETSIVFSVLLGRVMLGERLTHRRVVVCLVVTLGAVCIGYAR